MLVSIMFVGNTLTFKRIVKSRSAICYQSKLKRNLQMINFRTMFRFLSFAHFCSLDEAKENFILLSCVKTTRFSISGYNQNAA